MPGLPVSGTSRPPAGSPSSGPACAAGALGPEIPYALSRNPGAGQWDGRRLSQRVVADYKPFVMTDGEGIRCSLYVSGCPFRCERCWNESIWDFKAGRPWTPALEDRVLADLAQPYVQGMTFLGGEPMLNTPVLLPLARRIRAEFGETRDIWCWTGYTWEELMRPGETPDKEELLSLTDVLVDGRYVHALSDALLQFRGSANQRVIDVPASLERGEVALWGRLHDLTRHIPEVSPTERLAGEGAH